MKTPSMLKILSLPSVVAASVCSLNAALIYEPFADPDSPLPGNTPGAGLSGTWSGGNGYLVKSGSYSFGSLPTSGNRTEIDSGRTDVRVSVGSTLADAGLMNDGSTLWFSALHLTQPVASGNMDFGFALGSSNLGGSNNVPMNSGQGVGFSVKNGQIRASYWDNGGAQRNSGEAFTPGDVVLVVGEVIWGSNGGVDTVNLYTPDSSLVQGSVVSTIQQDLNQSAFDRIAFANKADELPVGIDEIRFGASYDEVIGVVAAPPIPEPSAALLGALGGFLLLYRRK